MSLKPILTTAFLFTLAFNTQSLAESAGPLTFAWQSTHFLKHPLVGKIWSTKQQKFVSIDQLKSEIKSSQFILLGEIHDNPDHHKWQARLLKQIKQPDGPSPVLVVEMIPEKLGSVFGEFKKNQQNPLQNLAKLGTALKWKKRGWGDWIKYQPIFRVAIEIGARVVAGNLNREDTRRIGRKGLSVLSETERKQWSVGLNYTPAQTSLMNDLLFESHCKLVPKQALSPMLLVQRVRDGAMAGAMLSKLDNATAVLISGSGHARNDIAVPRILRAKAPKAKIVTISFTEVTPDQKNAKQYERQSADKQRVFDYLFFTPKFEIKDHCAALAKRFEKQKLKKPTK